MSLLVWAYSKPQHCWTSFFRACQSSRTAGSPFAQFVRSRIGRYLDSERWQDWALLPMRDKLDMTLGNTCQRVLLYRLGIILENKTSQNKVEPPAEL